jgi:TonB family protein
LLPVLRPFVLAVAFGIIFVAGAFAQADGKASVVSESVARQRVKVKVDPEYPATARQFKIFGEVVTQVTIGADGKIESVDDVKGNMILQASVKNVLRKWVFEPYVLDGKPIRIKTSLSFNFRL